MSFMSGIDEQMTSLRDLVDVSAQRVWWLSPDSPCSWTQSLNMQWIVAGGWTWSSEWGDTEMDRLRVSGSDISKGLMVLPEVVIPIIGEWTRKKKKKFEKYYLSAMTTSSCVFKRLNTFLTKPWAGFFNMDIIALSMTKAKDMSQG